MTITTKDNHCSKCGKKLKLRISTKISSSILGLGKFETYPNEFQVTEQFYCKGHELAYRVKRVDKNKKLISYRWIEPVEWVEANMKAF